MRPLRTAAALLVAAAALAVPAAAADLPEPSLDGLCHDADLVVEGRAAAGGDVEIVRVFAGADLLGGNRASVHVPCVAGLPPVRAGGPRGAAAPIAPEAVFLFLRRDAADGRWLPVAGTTDGSAAAIWVAGGRCLAYGQEESPGPYVLRPCDGAFRGIPGDPVALRAAIVSGVARAIAWRATLALADPTERAWALAAWLDPAASPDAERTTRLFHVRAPLLACGEAAVEPLGDLLGRPLPDLRLDTAIDVAGGLGDRGRPLVPRLAALALGAEGRPPRLSAAGALGRIGDRDAIPVLRKAVAAVPQADMWALEVVAGALVRLRATEAFGDVAARLPAAPDGVRAEGVAHVLVALAKLDAERAKPLIRRYIGLPVMAGQRAFLVAVLRGDQGR